MTKEQILKLIEDKLRRPKTSKESLTNVVADVAQAIADNSGGGGGSAIKYFNPRILYSDGTSSLELESGKTPIAIEVVPADHTEDGYARWISLKNMSLEDPENGTAVLGEGAGIIWGNTSTLINEAYTDIPVVYALDQENPASMLVQEFSEVPVGLSQGIPVLPMVINAEGIPYGPAPAYKYGLALALQAPISQAGIVAPPFDAELGINYAYRATEVNGEPINNPLAQFNGKELTENIIAAATATETVGAITNSSEEGHYPAAMCCHRYVTEGTTAGDWYLPAAGESCYALVNAQLINDKIQSIIDAGFDAIKMPYYNEESFMGELGYFLWSSSEGSADNACLFNAGGVFGINDKVVVSSTLRVRAFLAL